MNLLNFSLLAGEFLKTNRNKTFFFQSLFSSEFLIDISCLHFSGDVSPFRKLKQMLLNSDLLLSLFVFYNFIFIINHDNRTDKQVNSYLSRRDNEFVSDYINA